MEKQYDIAIIGAGPAGLSASIYAQRAGFSTVCLEQNVHGGQIINTPEVEKDVYKRQQVEMDTLCDLRDEYRGAGWGQNTPESTAMTETLPKLEGIFIENVYNSKVVVALADYAAQGLLEGGACYLHTGGFGSLSVSYTHLDVYKRQR